MSQIVQVVSMLLVIIKEGERGFQSKEVRGAVKSVDLLLDRRARGVSFWIGCVWKVLDRVMEFPCGVVELEEPVDGLFGSDHKRRWSPEVARSSVDAFVEPAGSHKIRVMG